MKEDREGESAEGPSADISSSYNRNSKLVKFIAKIHIKTVPSLINQYFFNSPAIKSFQPVYIIMEKELQKKSLDLFFRHEYQKLVNFVSRNLEDRFFETSPEDIIQDVALGLIDRLEIDTQIGNMTAYIYRAVKNKIIDSQRKKQRNVSIENFTDRKNGNYLLNTGRKCSGGP